MTDLPNVPSGAGEGARAVAPIGGVFPLGRVFDKRPSRTPEPADDEPRWGAIIERPAALPAVVEVLPTRAGEPDPDPLDEAASAFAAASRSAATRRAYLSDLRGFARWCRADGAVPLPATPRTVARYVTHLAGLGRAVTTIDRHTAAIAHAHRLAGYDAPNGTEEVRAVLAGIRNTLGRRPNKKKALTADLAAKVAKRIPSDLVGLRDRAMVLLCFAAALRRSELVALQVSDLEWHRRGLVVLLRRSKTDQQGKGRQVAVLDGKLKVPAAVEAWVKAAGLVDGPLFRGCDRGRVAARGLTGTHFARILKGRCEDAGLDPTLFSGHSCRRGFATSADDAGADLKATSEHLGHRKLETTAGYMEAGDLFRRNAGKGFV